jgi:hypothetical protein
MDNRFERKKRGRVPKDSFKVILLFLVELR